MVGQKELLSRIKDLISNNAFPKFSILVGLEGSGKRTLCKQVAKLLSAEIYISDNSVDNVREVVSQSYKCSSRPTMFVFPNADNMSPAAKSALLKITEEPPKNVYFVLTLEDANSTLNTIKSRGQVFYMCPYTADEIDAYYHDNAIDRYSDERAIIRDICSTPGEVEKSILMGTVDFYAYVGKVVDNIAEVSCSNSFKIADKIKLKESDELSHSKYDLRLFFKAFMFICTNYLTLDVNKFSQGIKITSKALQELKVTGVNKQMLFDLWLLDIRRSWS